MILRARCFLMLIKDAGMKNGRDAVLHQPLHVAVGTTLRDSTPIRWDGFHAQLVNLPAGEGGKHRAEAQRFQKYRPEGIVLIEVQDAGMPMQPRTAASAGRARNRIFFCVCIQRDWAFSAEEAPPSPFSQRFPVMWRPPPGKVLTVSIQLLEQPPQCRPSSCRSTRNFRKGSMVVF